MNRHRWGCCTDGPAECFACETEPRVSSTRGDAARVAYRGTDLGKHNPPERPLAGALAARHRAGDSGRRNLPIGRWGCCIVGPQRGRNTLLPWADRSLLGVGGDAAPVALPV